MHFLSAFLFAISANLDNLTIGVAYGIKRIKIEPESNLIIACITAIGTFLSMSLGSLFTEIISTETANLIGSSILVFVGGLFIVEFIWKEFMKKRVKAGSEVKQEKDKTWLKKSMEEGDKDGSGNIDMREAVTLAFALTVNNIGLGIAGSITGLSVFWTSVFTLLVSYVFISAGQRFGRGCLSRLFGKYATVVSGLIIFGMGIYEMFV